MARSKKSEYDTVGLQELLYQALETESGGIQVYTHALKNVQNDGLREEWSEYLEQTRRHHRILLDVFASLGLDPGARTPGRDIVADLGASLVQAIDKARNQADPATAEIVAGECVVLAETKDHLNWELIGRVIKHGKGEAIDVLRKAHEQIEDEEDRHVYHSTGWTRELWIEALGLPAVLPPPEEVRDVKTKIGAARAEHARDRMM